VADVVLNLIHVDKIKPNGSSFSSSRVMDKKEFLASTDHSFRPVNMSVGPDGSIYVVDMYRQVIEHPEWIPAEIQKTLDLNAGKDKGRIYKINMAGSKLSVDATQFKTVEGMISSLQHNNQWVRKTAHRLLMNQSLNDSQFNKLFQTLQSEVDHARLHAMWILHGKKKLNGKQLMNAMDDPSSGIRENALVLAEDFIDADETILRKCLSLTSDSNQRVRMQATLTISTLPPSNHNKFRTEIMNALATSSALGLDEWNIAAITLAAQQEASELFVKLATGESKKGNMSLLTSLALASGRSLSGMQSVLQSLRTTSLDQESQAKIVHQLSKSTNADLPKSLLAFIQPLEQSGGVQLVSELAALRSKIKLPPSPKLLALSRAALDMVLDHSIADSLRIQQMSLVEFLPYQKKSSILFQCLQNTEPLKLQEAALRQLSTYQEVEIGQRIVKLWKELSPQTRRYASDLLLYVELHHDALLSGLENGTINIGEMNFDLERRRTLLWWTENEKTKKRAEALFSDAGVTTRQEAIEKMNGALTLQGTAINGAKVFESICSNCHIYGSKGKDVGPVLTEISRKSKATLLHDILDPNATADTKYISHRLETQSGFIHIGIVDIETDHSITIKKMGGEKVTVNKTDVKRFSSLGTSLMMEGLESSMTDQELADLLEFLQGGN
jgi:putative heme-binding domain-containing protein